MLYYKIIVNFREKSKESERVDLPSADLERIKAAQYMAATCTHYERGRKQFIFVIDMKRTSCKLGAICIWKMTKADVARFLKEIEITPVKCEHKEITFREIASMLAVASQMGSISDSSEALNQFDLGNVARYKRFLSEDVLDRNVTKAELFQHANSLKSSSLKEELNRIFYEMNHRGFAGHPVHYLIKSDDVDFQNAVVNDLALALIKVNRLVSRRICKVDCRNTAMTLFPSIYRTAFGGTVCISLPCSANEESNDIVRAEDGIERAVHASHKWSYLCRNSGRYAGH